MPLARVLRRCISYSSSKRDVGEPGVLALLGWLPCGSMSELLPLLELGVVA